MVVVNFDLLSLLDLGIDIANEVEDDSNLVLAIAVLIFNRAPLGTGPRRLICFADQLVGLGELLGLVQDLPAALILEPTVQILPVLWRLLLLGHSGDEPAPVCVV